MGQMRQNSPENQLEGGFVACSLYIEQSRKGFQLVPIYLVLQCSFASYHDVLSHPKKQLEEWFTQHWLKFLVITQWCFSTWPASEYLLPIGPLQLFTKTTLSKPCEGSLSDSTLPPSVLERHDFNFTWRPLKIQF